jgi:hypothetical protein
MGAVRSHLPKYEIVRYKKLINPYLMRRVWNHAYLSPKNRQESLVIAMRKLIFLMCSGKLPHIKCNRAVLLRLVSVHQHCNFVLLRAVTQPVNRLNWGRAWVWDVVAGSCSIRWRADIITWCSRTVDKTARNEPVSLGHRLLHHWVTVLKAGNIRLRSCDRFCSESAIADMAGALRKETCFKLCIL